MASTVPDGKSTGSLQVIAVSPARPAIFPLINTVELPRRMVARFKGGLEKLVPGAIGK